MSLTPTVSSLVRLAFIVTVSRMGSCGRKQTKSCRCQIPMFVSTEAGSCRGCRLVGWETKERYRGVYTTNITTTTTNDDHRTSATNGHIATTNYTRSPLLV